MVTVFFTPLFVVVVTERTHDPAFIARTPVPAILQMEELFVATFTFPPFGTEIFKVESRVDCFNVVPIRKFFVPAVLFTGTVVEVVEVVDVEGTVVAGGAVLGGDVVVGGTYVRNWYIYAPVKEPFSWPPNPKIFPSTVCSILSTQKSVTESG